MKPPPSFTMMIIWGSRWLEFFSINQFWRYPQVNSSNIIPHSRLPRQGCPLKEGNPFAPFGGVILLRNFGELVEVGSWTPMIYRVLAPSKRWFSEPSSGCITWQKKKNSELHPASPHRVTMGADELSIQGPSEIAHLDRQACVVLGVGAEVLHRKCAQIPGWFKSWLWLYLISIICSEVSNYRGLSLPIGSMYGIFTYSYHKDQPNVGKYTIHGSLSLVSVYFTRQFHQISWRMSSVGLAASGFELDNAYILEIVQYQKWCFGNCISFQIWRFGGVSIGSWQKHWFIMKVEIP